MMNYHKCYNYHHQLRKLDQAFRRRIMKEELKLSKGVKFRLLYFICLSFLSCSLIWTSHIFGAPFSMSYVFVNDSLVEDNILHGKGGQHDEQSSNPSLFTVSNGTLSCDRSHFRTDICFMKGDIRTDPNSSTIFLYNSTNPKAINEISPSSIDEIVKDQELQHEVIKPYTRKWETSVMNTIEQLHLISKPKPSKSHHKCDILHDVPAIFFSTGGYTGNVYHEFNDGIIPLYLTSRHFNKRVVFVILEYHDWWYMKYGKIISELSDYPPINFNVDSRTHCFQEAIVGLRISNELTIDSNTLDFQALLDRAFEPRLLTKGAHQDHTKRPKLVILSRSGSRSIKNEYKLIKLAKKIGFNVQVLKPNRKTELSTMYKAISSSDVMVGVHGAAMTHFLFLKPGSLVIQVVPLGTDWAAETYYGEPAKKYQLRYIGYKVHPKESSLYYKYDENDPVLRDPDSVNKLGWEYTKKVYLDDQFLELDLKRFKKILVQAYGDFFVKSRVN